jgi:hypothetical protein
MSEAKAKFGEGRTIEDIYREEVLPLRTRAARLLGRKCPARILHTLLGFEVQASRRRIHCPDLATARYLRVFMEVGCRSIRLPYDPTITLRLVPELESALEEMSRTARRRQTGERGQALRRMYRTLRRRLEEASAVGA